MGERHSAEVNCVVGTGASTEQLEDVEACKEAMNEEVNVLKTTLGQRVSMVEVQDVKDTILAIAAALEPKATNDQSQEFKAAAGTGTNAEHLLELEAVMKAMGELVNELTD